MTKAVEWDGRTTGVGGVVVYGKSSIRDQWDEVGDTDEYPSVLDFEESSMYPFSERAVGEYHIESLLFDTDTDTLVVMIDDAEASGALNEQVVFIKPSVVDAARKVVEWWDAKGDVGSLLKMAEAIESLKEALATP